jgi:hypothetical protein
MKLIQRRGDAIAIQIDDHRIAGDVDGAVAKPGYERRAWQAPRRTSKAETEEAAARQKYRGSESVPCIP